MPQPDDPESTWRTQPDDPVALTPDQLCAMARSRKRLNARLRRGIVAVTIVLAGLLLFNIYRVEQPWIRLGQAWTLLVIAYLFGPLLDRRRTSVTEPCVQFLVAQHEQRRRGYLRIRRRLFLFIPGIVASWWGGGPRLAFLAGPWPFLAAGAALLAVWFAFGKAAEKAARERDAIHRV